MMPAFGLTASRELLPRFVETLDKVSASIYGYLHDYTALKTARRNVERPYFGRADDAGRSRMAWQSHS